MVLIILLLSIPVLATAGYALTQVAGAEQLSSALGIFFLFAGFAGFVFRLVPALLMSLIVPVGFLQFMNSQWYLQMIHWIMLAAMLGIVYLVSLWLEERDRREDTTLKLNHSRQEMSRIIQQQQDRRGQRKDDSKKILALSSRVVHLKNVAKTFGSSLRESEVLENLLTAGRRLLKADRLAVYRPVGENLERQVEQEVKDDLPATVVTAQELAGHVLRNGIQLTHGEVMTTPLLKSLRDRSSLKFQFAAHLGTDKESFGVLVADRGNGEMFDDDDLQLASILADLGSLALRNAALYSKVEWMANVDGLTSLYTKRYFQDYMAIEIRKSRRYKNRFALIMSDIDHFKKFNDDYGHQAGDYVLQQTAALFQEMTRNSDLVSRYGGEEFITLLPETDIEGARILAERIRIALEEREFEFEGNKLSVTVSLGVATFPDHGTELDGLIKRCDLALYWAKNHGRNQTVIWKPEMGGEEESAPAEEPQIDEALISE